jgi:hypothetical protein
VSLWIGVGIVVALLACASAKTPCPHCSTPGLQQAESAEFKVKNSRRRPFHQGMKLHKK